MTIRFFMMQSHYASTLDFSNDALEAYRKGYVRLANGMRLIHEMAWIEDEGELNEKQVSQINKMCDNCYHAMNDDFNSPILIAQLFEAGKMIHAVKDGSETISEQDLELLKKTMHDFIFDVLGLVDVSAEQENDSNTLDGTINLLIELRNQARQNKDFATSDRIRDELKEVGVQLKDGKDGTTYSLN